VNWRATLILQPVCGWFSPRWPHRGGLQLTAFAGVYRSEEIEPVYRIVVEEGSLVLKRLKSKPAKLEPTITNQFGAPFGSLRFIHDAQGQVTGFILNAGPIKGFKFKKST
jgi:hypothetical protein